MSPNINRDWRQANVGWGGAGGTQGRGAEPSRAEPAITGRPGDHMVLAGTRTGTRTGYLAGTPPNRIALGGLRQERAAVK